jgi:hypothetical protein
MVEVGVVCAGLRWRETWPSVFPSEHPSVISDVTPSGGWSLLCAKFLQAITMG